MRAALEAWSYPSDPWAGEGEAVSPGQDVWFLDTGPWWRWQLYAAEKALAVAAPDTFRVAPEAVLSFMAARNVVLLIDVFHDDTDSCIALQEPAGRAST